MDKINTPGFSFSIVLFSRVKYKSIRTRPRIVIPTLKAASIFQTARWITQLGDVVVS